MIRKYESTILKSKLNQIIILGKGSIKNKKKYGFIHIWVGGWFRIGTISIDHIKSFWPTFFTIFLRGGGQAKQLWNMDDFFEDFPSEYKIDNMMTEGCIMCFNSLLKLASLILSLTSPACTHPLTGSERPGRSELAIHYLICSIVNNIQNTNWAFYYPHDLKSWITVQKMEEVKKFSRRKNFKKTFCSKWAKKPKNNMFFVFIHILGAGSLWFVYETAHARFYTSR